MKRLILVVAIASSLQAKCQRSDAGPVLQAAIDVACAVQKVEHGVVWLGRKIKHAAVYVVRGLD